MTHAVRQVEGALEDARRTLRRIDVMHRVREQASAALARDDFVHCASALAILAKLGGPLFHFSPPTNFHDAVGWHPIIERNYCALEEWTRHMNAMEARLLGHLADPRPWDPAWIAQVAKTVILNERFANRWNAAIPYRAAHDEVMSP